MTVMNVVKGVGLGVVAGMAVGYVGSKMMPKSQKRTMKKKAAKALKGMENMLDTASYMLR